MDITWCSAPLAPHDDATDGNGLSQMTTPPGNGGSDRRRRLLKVGVVTASLVVVAAGIWWLFPIVTGHILSGQLEDLQERTGLVIDADSVATTGLGGIELRNFQIALPDDDAPLATIDEVDATVDLISAVTSRPTVSELSIAGLDVTLHRHADGSDDLQRLRRQLAGDDDDGDLDEDDEVLAPDQMIDALASRVLRHFGDLYPAVAITDASLTLTHDDGVAPWPITSISTEQLTVDGPSSTAAFETQLQVAAPQSPQLSVPEQVDLSGTLRRPVYESTIAVDVDPAIRVVSNDHFPFAEASLSGLRIEGDYVVELIDPAVNTRLGADVHPLASAQRIHLQFDRWPGTIDDLKLDAVEIDSPQAYVEFDENGGSNISDLYAIARQPPAHRVAARARAVGDAYALVDDTVTDAPAADDADDDPGDDTGGLWSSLSIRDLLIDYVPRSTTIRDLRVVVEDRRHHDTLTQPAEHFEITGELLELHHSPLQGILEGSLQLQSRTDAEGGVADVEFHIPYRSGRWNASLRLDALELTQFAQLGGPTVADHLHGGEISASVDIENDGGDEEATTHFDGIVAADNVRLFVGSVADDTIDIDSTSLQFEGYYNPAMAIPAPEVMEPPVAAEDESGVADDEGGPGDSDDDRGDDDRGDDDRGDDDRGDDADRGGLVLEEARATIGDVEATFHSGIYGLDGLQRPARLDAGIQLPTTELQDIIDAIPAALHGPLDGLQMVGSLTWDFDIEIPLYRASDMVWNARVDLSPDLEVVDIPSEVDVFAMVDAFEHTIEDEWEEIIEYRDRDVSYRRTVEIPEMRPTPARWLLDNTSLELEQIDAIRRDREWPPVPDYHPELGVDADTLASPDYWLSSLADEQAADRPWDAPPENNDFWSGFAGVDSGDDDDILIYEQSDPPPFHQTDIDIDSERYGPYVYVPLHHISPYMVRAIMTTEDNSFFTHSGFNFLAIRQSVEQNLEAGGFVRGASTISMQLAKNLFLDRDRLLSRKLQEVALVWLMESVADVPKARMMELYLNIIEFGPGIYGIHEAAMHYFGKRPDELEIDEAAWLVSIVPNPKEYHRYYEGGEITPYWFRRMERYIRAMEARDRISEREMEDASEQPPEFHIPEDGDPLLRSDTDDVEPDEEIESDEDGDAPSPIEWPQLN